MAYSKQKKDNGWVAVSLDQEGKNLAERWCNGDYQILDTLKDKRDSWVARVAVQERVFVVKEIRNFTYQSRPKLSMVLRQTLFGPFAVKVFKKMNYFCQQGVKTSIPLFAVYKREKAQVKTSFVAMEEERHIQKLTAQQIELAKQSIEPFHRLGYLHGDPSQDNVVFSDRGLIALDFKPRRNFFGKVGCAYEHLKLALNFGVTFDSLPNTWAFKGAKLYYLLHRQGLNKAWKRFCRFSKLS